MIKDNRQFSRMREPFEAECQKRGSGEPWRVIQTINLSATGMRFGSKLPYDLGVQLDLRMHLPLTGELLEITGEVIRAEPIAGQLCEIAVQFTKITTSQEMQIDEINHFMMNQPERPSSPESKNPENK